MAIKCCRDCKPPKRYPGCSDHCEEYRQEKAYYKKEQQWLKEQRARVISKNSTLGDYPLPSRGRKKP